MIKKYVSSALVFVMCISSVVPAFSNESEQFLSLNSTQLTAINLDKAIKQEMLNEISVIDEYFQNSAYIKDITSGDEGYIYTFDIPLESGENITSNIQIEKQKNGNVKFHITEGEIKNELVFTVDNDIILDGHEIIIESKQTNSRKMLSEGREGSIHPMALGSVYYDVNPFWGKAKDYNDNYEYDERNILFNTAIQAIATSTLIAVVSAAVPGVGTYLTVASFASLIKDAYTTYNLKGKSLFYTKESWDNPKAPPIEETMTSYAKIRTKWYTDSEYKNEAKKCRETYYMKTKLRDI